MPWRLQRRTLAHAHLLFADCPCDSLAPGVRASCFCSASGFERSYTVGATPTLDVSTIRGKIDVSVGTADRIVVRGTATVRLGLSSPTEAYELVKRVAANPPIEQKASTLRLRPPSAPEEQRAMTVAYAVSVPRGTVVRTISDSGETTVAGVSGKVST